MDVAEIAAFHAGPGGLTVDGVLGPRTWEPLQDETWQPPGGQHIIVGGERLACGSRS